MKHTFASFSRHPAPCRPFLVKKHARTSIMQNIVVLRAIHFSIGHFPLLGFLF
jgi:hypothetical protein